MFLCCIDTYQINIHGNKILMVLVHNNNLETLCCLKSDKVDHCRDITTYWFDIGHSPNFFLRYKTQRTSEKAKYKCKNCYLQVYKIAKIRSSNTVVLRPNCTDMWKTHKPASIVNNLIKLTWLVKNKRGKSNLAEIKLNRSTSMMYLPQWGVGALLFK